MAEEQADRQQEGQSGGDSEQGHVAPLIEAPTGRKKHRRVVRKGAEKVLESEAVASFGLHDDIPREEIKAQGGNDARLIADVPPHWGRR